MLPALLDKENFMVLMQKQDVFKPTLRQLGTNTYLLGIKELIAGIKRRIGEFESSTYPYEDTLGKLLEDHTSGVIYNWGPVSILAQLRT